jgi:hypothetical protein
MLLVKYKNDPVAYGKGGGGHPFSPTNLYPLFPFYLDTSKQYEII